MEIWVLVAGLIILVTAVLFIKKPVSGDQQVEKIKKENEELRILLATAEERSRGLGLEKERLLDELREERERLGFANQSLESARSYYKAQQEMIAEQKAEIEKVQEKFNKDFELIANRILDEKTKKFTESN